MKKKIMDHGLCCSAAYNDCGHHIPQQKIGGQQSVEHWLKRNQNKEKRVGGDEMRFFEKQDCTWCALHRAVFDHLLCSYTIV